MMCNSKPFRPHRARAVEGVDGTVLEIGFGSGLNLPHYPSSVERLLAVDPSERARELAADRIAAVSFPVEAVGLDGASLAVEDASVDHVVSTFTLCTIPDVHGALAEVRRVLKPGGTFRVLEHGLSHDGDVAAWQHRLTPIQKRMAGGCHLDRPIVTLVERAGFSVEALRQWTEGRPRSYTTMSSFTARVR